MTVYIFLFGAMKRFGKLAFCVILAFFCSSSMAWDDLGHQVVAAIAWDQMTPKARAKVIEMFKRRQMIAAFVN